MSKITISNTKSLHLPKFLLSDDSLNDFKIKLNAYIRDLDTAVSNGENEEHIKNIINDFLRMNFYSNSKFAINTDKYIDSTIKEEGNLLAIIETKLPTNKNEMITDKNLNRKAFWEIVYYYLERTIDTSKPKAMISINSNLRRAIITDGFNWFLFDAADIHSITDGEIERRYRLYKNGKLPFQNDSTAFYEELRQHLDNCDITNSINYVYFNVKECMAKKTLIKNLYQVLSESYLLKNNNNNNYESHSLNSGFYHELLYIMGLKETTIDNRLMVEIDPTIKNSLSDQVYYLLKDKDVDEKEINELTFELVLIWVNRLLFIKLFEGQLISFNSDTLDYHILSRDKISSFDDLQNLFFEILGTQDRQDNKFSNQFNKIPYLNSSLFERQKVEKDYVMIRYLDNNIIQRKSKSVLGKKSNENLTIIEYIIDFLNSYNFSTISEDITNQKEIIDASVLGLIFEKLNGYKDGANYTPSIITEYIAKEAVEKAVLNSINKGMGWKYCSLIDVEDKIESIEERKMINEIINSIKICDPAVGSGHFLVSVLNRIIAVKKQLGVLFKFQSDRRIKEYQIDVINDVLVVLDGDGHPFMYKKNDNESREIQETLFNEKRIIIENCLFGVDINPKAVYICQLRLWIELLKNAYYKNGIMETLPNIDINIKVGNTLMNKVDFVTGKKVKSDDKDTKIIIDHYKKLVTEYKSVSNKERKKQLSYAIDEAKGRIHGFYVQTTFFDDKSDTTFENSFEWAFEFPEILDEKGKFVGFDVVIGNPPYIQLQSIKKEADRLLKNNYKYTTFTRTGDIYCLFYEQSFRLLKDNGILAFVTSNKWMRAAYGEELRKFLSNNTNPIQLIDFSGQKVFDSATVDVNILIYQKEKNQHNTLACTIKDENWRNNLSDYVRHNAEVNSFDNFGSWIILSPIEQSIKRKIEEIGTPLKNWNVQIFRGILTGYNDAFIISGDKKNELVSADPKSAEIIRPILRGMDIKRYSINFSDQWLIYIPWHFPLQKEERIKGSSTEAENLFKQQYPIVYSYLNSYRNFLENRNKSETGIRYEWYALQRWGANYSDDFNRQKIIWGELSDKPKFALDKEGIFVISNTVFMMTGNHLDYLLAFLNSKLSQYYFSSIATTSGVGTVRWLKYKVELLPVPLFDNITPDIRTLMISLMEKPIENSQEIDRLIFSIYNFSPSEIELILNASSM